MFRKTIFILHYLFVTKKFLRENSALCIGVVIDAFISSERLCFKKLNVHLSTLVMLCFMNIQMKHLALPFHKSENISLFMFTIRISFENMQSPFCDVRIGTRSRSISTSDSSRIMIEKNNDKSLFVL